MQSNVHSFIISLPKDEARRRPLEEQLIDLNMSFAVFPAIHGANLSSEELEQSYDRKKAIRLFNRELSKGELGCTLSHIAIYRKMIAEDIPHAFIMEDDAKILDDDLPTTLVKLTQLYAKDWPVAVLLSHVKRYNGNRKTCLDINHCVYEAYRGVGAHGYFITKAAAEVLLQKLFPAYVVADKWEHFQKYISVHALVPYVVGLTPASHSSSIDGMGLRMKKIEGGGNYLYYLRKYTSQLLYAIVERPFIKVERQDKLSQDIH